MSRSRQSQVDVVGLTTEVTENVLATLRGELSNDRDAFRETQERERDALRETFQEQTQQFLNTLGNRTQSDQAGAASAQQRTNDRIDSLQAQLQEERIHHERRGGLTTKPWFASSKRLMRSMTLESWRCLYAAVEPPNAGYD